MWLFVSGKIWLNLEQSVLGPASLGNLPWSKWPLTALLPLRWGVPRLGPPSCCVPQVSTYILHSNPVPPPPRELRQGLSTVHTCRSTACHVVAVQRRQTSFYCASPLLHFYKPKVCGNPELSKSLRAILPTAFAPFMYLCHILVILTILQTFSLLLYILG